MRGRAAVAEGCDRVRLGQAVEPREQANALSTSKLGLGRAPSEEQAIEFAIADEHIELMYRDVDKEQHHQPQLNGQEAWPREVLDYIGGKVCYCSTWRQEKG